MKLTNQCELRYLSVFLSCSTFISSATTSDTEENPVPQKAMKCGTLFVTTEAIHLTTNFQWLSDSSNKTSDNNSVTLVQPLTNLVELENLTKTSFTLNFMDELENTIEKWKITFDSNSRIAKTLEIIDSIWRNIFCLPLINDDQKLL